LPRVVITGPEFADLMGWSISTLWRRHREGTLPVETLPYRPGYGIQIALPVAEAFFGYPIDTDALELKRIEKRNQASTRRAETMRGQGAGK